MIDTHEEMARLLAELREGYQRELVGGCSSVTSEIEQNFHQLLDDFLEAAENARVVQEKMKAERLEYIKEREGLVAAGNALRSQLNAAIDRSENLRRDYQELCDAQVQWVEKSDEAIETAKHNTKSMLRMISTLQQELDELRPKHNLLLEDLGAREAAIADLEEKNKALSDMYAERTKDLQVLEARHSELKLASQAWANRIDEMAIALREKEKSTLDMEAKIEGLKGKLVDADRMYDLLENQYKAIVKQRDAITETAMQANRARADLQTQLDDERTHRLYSDHCAETGWDRLSKSEANSLAMRDELVKVKAERDSAEHRVLQINEQLIATRLQAENLQIELAAARDCIASHNNGAVSECCGKQHLGSSFEEVTTIDLPIPGVRLRVYVEQLSSFDCSDCQENQETSIH